MTRSASRKAHSSKHKKIKYAVVGLGHLAQVAVLPAFASAPNSELFAIVSNDEAKLRELGKKYKVEHAYSDEDYDRALKVVDAVYLVVPNHVHREYAVRAAAAGVHVLCEKPMAVTEEECKEMIAAADENNVKLMIAYRLHFEKANLKAIELAHSGKLGEPRFFDSAFAQQVVADNIRVTEPVERGGGPVYDMGVYCINAARYLFRAEPTAVTALSARNREKRFRKAEEMTSVVMEFPGARLANFTCSFGAAEISRYTLVGTKGCLTLQPAYNYSKALAQQITIGDKTTSKNFAKSDHFAPQLIYFSDCIMRNTTPEPSGWEGLADVRIVQAIYESARTGKKIELSNFHRKKRPGMKQEIRRPAHGKPSTIKAESPSG
jgi:glucose-fructose oxidoreductase